MIAASSNPLMSVVIRTWQLNKYIQTLVGHEGIDVCIYCKYKGRRKAEIEKMCSIGRRELKKKEKTDKGGVGGGHG